MKHFYPYLLCIGVIIGFVICAGCAGTSQSGNGQKAAATTVATPVPLSAPVTTATTSAYKATPAPTAKKEGVLYDTTVVMQWDDFKLINLQEEFGVPYLYPDEQYKLTVSTAAGPNAGHVNALILDEIDMQLFKVKHPVWDPYTKAWVYEGIGPVAQLNDVMSAQSKTFKIKKQGWYYLGLDDRQLLENQPGASGGGDKQYKVPAFEVYVKIAKI